MAGYLDQLIDLALQRAGSLANPTLMGEPKAMLKETLTQMGQYCHDAMDGRRRSGFH